MKQSRFKAGWPKAALAVALLVFLGGCGNGGEEKKGSETASGGVEQSETASEGSANGGSGEKTKAPEGKPVDVTFIDNDNFTAKATKVWFDEFLCYEGVNMVYTNKTKDTTFTVTVPTALLDGYEVDSVLYMVDVPPGQTVESPFYTDFSTLEDFMSSDVNEIKLELVAKDETGKVPVERSTASIYPNGEEAAKKDALKMPATANTIVDDDKMKVTVLDQKVKDDEYRMSVLVENKSDDACTFVGQDMAINGKSTQLHWSSVIEAHGKRVMPIIIDDMDLEKYGLKSLDEIKTISGKLRMSSLDNIIDTPAHESEVKTFSLKDPGSAQAPPSQPTQPNQPAPPSQPAQPNQPPQPKHPGQLSNPTQQADGKGAGEADGKGGAIESTPLNPRYGDKVPQKECGPIVGDWEQSYQLTDEHWTISFKEGDPGKVEIANGDNKLTGTWEAYYTEGKHDPNDLLIKVKLDGYDGDDHGFSNMSFFDGMLSTQDSRLFIPLDPDTIIIEDYAAAKYDNVHAWTFNGVWQLVGGIARIDNPAMTIDFSDEDLSALGLKIPLYIGIYEERIRASNQPGQSVLSPGSRGKFIKGVLYVSNTETDKLGLGSLPLYIVAPGVIHAVYRTSTNGVNSEAILILHKVSNNHNDPKFLPQTP